MNKRAENSRAEYPRLWERTHRSGHSLDASDLGVPTSAFWSDGVLFSVGAVSTLSDVESFSLSVRADGAFT